MSETLDKVVDFCRRWPYCVGCALFSILLGAFSWFYLRNEIASLEVVYRGRSEEWEAMLLKLTGGSTLRQELADVRATTRRIEDNLVIEANLAENLWYFYKLEEQTKAQLPELHQISSPMNDKSPTFRRVPYGLRVVGSFDQVAGFLLALETGPRLVRINNFSFARTDPSGQSVALDLSIDLLGKK